MAQTYCDAAPGHQWHGPYHDREYGVPLTSDAALFERLMLEINQAGLSWLTILKKRDAFRRAYDGFDPAVVARYRARERRRLLADAGIVRNRLKVDAAIANAARILELHDSHDSFAKWLAAHHPRSKEEWVKLFKRTFRFTGGEIVGEFLMSIGYLPGAHVPGCPAYRRILRLRPPWSRVSAAVVALLTLGCGGERKPAAPSADLASLPGPAVALAVDDGGQGGVPVVLLHSLAGNTTHWSAQLEHLRQTRRAVALDLRGHGRSAQPRDGEYSLDAMAGDVGAAVDSLGLERFVLVGHSLGGGVAVTYAGAHPERVAGLFLLDPVGDATKVPADTVKAFLQRLEQDYTGTIEAYWGEIAGTDPAVRDRLLADLRATPRETVIRCLRAVFALDPAPALARYQGPAVSVVTPSNDLPFSMHRVGKGMPHHIVTGTGHWIQLEQPEQVNSLLDEFLEGVKGKGEEGKGKGKQ